MQQRAATVTGSVGTLRQYEGHVRREALRDYPELTAREYNEAYPAGSRKAEWVQAVWELARVGGQLTRYEADDFYRYASVRSLRHDFPRALPDGYLTPDVREHNHRYERGMVEARKHGRVRRDAA